MSVSRKAEDMLTRITLIIMVLATVLAIAAATATAETVLTADDTRRLAVEFNRQYLSAREDVDIAKAEISQAWGDALPNINLQSSYDRSFKIPKVFFTVTDSTGQSMTQELQTGFKNSFGTTVSLVQPIWRGGKVFTALSIARLYKDYSEANASAVEAQVVLAAEQLFHAAILADAELAVQQRALESNSANLDVVQKKYDRGIVSEFELLRARVEQQSVLPSLIEAESRVELARKQLKSFIGLGLTDTIRLVDSPVDTSLADLPSIAQLTDSAMRGRPEMLAADRLSEISKKGISVAKADYWPHLDAVGAYSWSAASDDFTLDENTSESWTAGLSLSFNIFPISQKKGAVNRARAQHNQALLTQQQTRDDIALEVEEAYTQLLQAKKALDIQGSTIAAAEEGLRIAQVRYDSGVGTQLEVLSAQTALTEARLVEAQALYAFKVARADLERVATIEL